MQICELSPRVTEMLAQPHRLEMNTSVSRRPLIYFPDFTVVATRSLCAEVRAGSGFGLAALRWQPAAPNQRELVTVILEIKAENDPRLKDPTYISKLKLAERVYRGMGFEFFILKRKKDIDCVDFRIVRAMVNKRHAKFTVQDQWFVSDFLRTSNGRRTFGEIEEALGGGPRARATIYSMHVRRILCIDLEGRFGPDSKVALMEPQK